MTVNIVGAPSTWEHVHSSAGGLLKRAIEKAKCPGSYKLEPLHNGHASHPTVVKDLTIGAACQDGVAIFFPNGIPAGYGCKLSPQKTHGKTFVNPVVLRQRLIEVLRENTDDTGTLEPVTLPPEKTSAKVPPPKLSDYTRLIQDPEAFPAFVALIEEMEAISSKEIGQIVQQALPEFHLSSFDLCRLIAHLAEKKVITPLRPVKGKNAYLSTWTVGTPTHSLAPPKMHKKEEVSPQPLTSRKGRVPTYVQLIRDESLFPRFVAELQKMKSFSTRTIGQVQRQVATAYHLTPLAFSLLMRHLEESGFISCMRRSSHTSDTMWEARQATVSVAVATATVVETPKEASMTPPPEVSLAELIAKKRALQEEIDRRRREIEVHAEKLRPAHEEYLSLRAEIDALTA